MFITISYLSSLSVKIAGFEHSVQSPSHTDSLRLTFLHFVYTPPLLYSVQIWLLWISIGTRPFEDVKASGKNEGKNIYIIHPHWIMHSTRLICLWRWLLFFICFYEFQKNKNKRGWNKREQCCIICLCYYKFLLN